MRRKKKWMKKKNIIKEKRCDQDDFLDPEPSVRHGHLHFASWTLLAARWLDWLKKIYMSGKPTMASLLRTCVPVQAAIWAYLARSKQLFLTVSFSLIGHYWLLDGLTDFDFLVSPGWVLWERASQLRPPSDPYLPDPNSFSRPSHSRWLATTDCCWMAWLTLTFLASPGWVFWERATQLRPQCDAY